MKNAIQLSMFDVAEVKLIYKSKVPPSQRRRITSSRDAYDLFKESWSPDTLDYYEEFKILLINRSNAVLGLIVCHNHPSGNLNPSESDTKITQKIKEAGSLMDIQLLDHLIINNEDYYSFADNGLL